ncbi:MAG: four helix bundle protein [Planctomycetales bacterium]|nr:four helix bundle protein [Planctomycetales bacterium]
MAGFVDLDVWKRSARMSATLYKELSELRDWGFRDQLTRSGLSVPSNIAEGYERDSHKEQARFYRIAKGSCGEARTQIYIGIEAEYIDRDTGLTWVEEYRQLAAMLAAMIKKKELGARS